MKNVVSSVSFMMIVALSLLLASATGICFSQMSIHLGCVEKAYAVNSDGYKLTAVPVAVQTQSKNSEAHTAYTKKLRALGKTYPQSSIKYRFVDLNCDGVDEMVVSWFPEVYTYSSGKVKRVDKAMIGSSWYLIAPKAKVFSRVESDHCGSAMYRYYKWNGKKFAHVATLYTHDKNDTSLRIRSQYWIKGKGDVSKKTAEKYVKKIRGKWYGKNKDFFIGYV